MDGNVANFVETEHIFVQQLLKGMKVAAYVQIRGSIPLQWSMKPNLKWSPPVKINTNHDNSLIAAGLHFSDTKQMYGPQYLVNLIDKKGSQDRVGKAMTKIVTDLNDSELKYIWFDFHAECKNMKW